MFPLARSYNWLIYRVINPPLVERLQRFAGGRVLDIGCGGQPYRPHVQATGARYVGIDHSRAHGGPRDRFIQASAYRIPLPDASIDHVLCNDVLEHLEEPADCLAEAYRCLRPGGSAVVTVPLFWHLHEKPRDFYRYTRFGLRYLLEKTGFRVLEIVPLSGFCVTFGQELTYFLYRLRRGGPLNPLWWIAPPLGQLVQLIALALHRVEKSPDFTFGYLVVAEKPAEPGA